MDNSLRNDENNLIGKKRQQTQSPFSAATPKSRLGKEPKRLFGKSPLANAADPNLEETAIESRPSSAMSSSDVSDVSYAYADPDGSKNLSMVSEGSEDTEDPDVTLADTFDEKMGIVDVDVDRTPTKSRRSSGSISPQPSSEQVASAPPDVVSQIQKGRDSWADDSTTSSPVCQQKPMVDKSLYEFELLEKETYHEDEIIQLKQKIVDLERAIRESNEARMFEEKVLLQQTESVSRKAKTDKAAAKEREERLEAEILELKKLLDASAPQDESHLDQQKQKEDQKEKVQLQEQLAQLTAQIEILTLKALNVEEMQNERAALDDRLKALETEKTQLEEQLDTVKQETASEVEKLKEEITLISSSSNHDEILAEHNQELDDLRKMMVSEVAALEAQLEAARLQATQSEALQEQARELEEALKASDAKIQELTAANAAQKTMEADAEHLELMHKVEQLTASLETVQATSDARILELTTINTQTLMSLDAAEARISELMNEKTSEADSRQQELQQHIQELTASLEHLQKASEAAIAQKTSEAESLQLEHQQKIQQLMESLEQTQTASEARIQELTASLEEAVVQKTSEADAHHQELKTKIEELSTALEASEAKVLELDAQKTFHAETRDLELQTKVDELNASESRVAELSAALEALQETSTRQILELEAEILEKTAASISREQEQKTVEQLTADIEQNQKTFDAQLAELTTANQQLEKTLEEKAEQTQIASEAVAALTEELNTARETQKTSDLKMEEFQNELHHARQSSTDQLEALETKHERETSELREQLDAALQKSQNAEILDEIREQLETAEAEVTRLNAQLEEAAEQMEAVQKGNAEQILELQNALEAAQTMSSVAAEGIQMQLEAVQLEKLALQSQLDTDRQTSDDLVQKLEEQKALVVELQQRLQAAGEAADEKVRVLGDTIQHQTDTIDTLRRAAEEQKHKDEQMVRDEVEKATSALLAEHEAAAARIAELEREIETIQADERDVEALNARIVELETSADTIRTQMEHMEAKMVEKTSQLEVAIESKSNVESALEEALQKVGRLEKEVQENSAPREHQIALDKAQLAVAELSEKLEAAEEAMSQKENTLMHQQNRIDTFQQLVERQTTELAVWKAQAQGMETLNGAVAEMSAQLREMSARLEASQRRIVEVEDAAQHDVTVMQEEVDGRQAELEAARALIAELRADLDKARAEVERLEKVCDEFDDDEAVLKKKIYALEDEVKALKGDDPNKKQPTMGLLQQARLGIKPLSPENSQQPLQHQFDEFSDAADHFEQQQQKPHLNNETARIPDSPNATQIGQKTMMSSTTLHPDDLDTSAAAATPSKKKANRSNCQQQ